MNRNKWLPILKRNDVEEIYLEAYRDGMRDAVKVVNNMLRVHKLKVNFPKFR